MAPGSVTCRSNQRPFIPGSTVEGRAPPRSQAWEADRIIPASSLTPPDRRAIGLNRDTHRWGSHDVGAGDISGRRRQGVGAGRHVGPLETEGRSVSYDSQALGAREVMHTGDAVREVSGSRANPDIGRR